MKFLSTPYCVGYPDAMAKMRMLSEEVQSKKSDDVIWFLEHVDVYTCGKMGSENDIKQPLNYPIIEADRGGKITYHGPGQLIIYACIDLKRLGVTISQFVYLLEETCIYILKHLGLNAQRDEHPGIWVNNEKIASVGLSVKNGITQHGISFNINPNLSNFDAINVCGMTDAKITSLEKLGIMKARKEIEPLFQATLQQLLKKENRATISNR